MSSAIEHFHHLIEADPQAAIRDLERLDAELFARNICFDGRAMPVHLRPHFFSPAARAALESAAQTVLAAALKAEKGVFGGDAERLYDALGVSDAERELLRIDPGYAEHVVWTRLDAFPGVGDDDVRFLEFNHDAPAGIGYSSVMSEIFLESEIMRRFQEKFAVTGHDSRPQLLTALLTAYRAFGGREKPNIAIVDWQGVRTSSDFEILRAYFEAAGYAAVIADPRALEMRDGKLHAGDFRIDLVYRRVVTSELLTKLDETKPFVTAYRTRAACFINSFRCRVSENKAFMAFLTDPAHLSFLTESERAALMRHLPWTRQVAEGKTDVAGEATDLIPYIATNRAELVLKPADAYGGSGVFVGSETDDATWENALRAALASDARWVVQRRVATPTEPYPIRVGDGFEFRPMKFNVNPFYLGDRMCGAVTRTSTDAVINVSAGGGSIPTFVVAVREAA
jgi:uncharacterized circularly permuted ATP-grasp superfamily protein